MFLSKNGELALDPTKHRDWPKGVDALRKRGIPEEELAAVTSTISDFYPYLVTVEGTAHDGNIQ